MGSGLILLVIVGAWLAVLVPMALRSHDSTASLKSADRFSDAMQILSGRRSGAGDRRDVVVPRRAPHPPVVSEPHVPRLPLEPRPAVTAAERRRRTLLVLLGLSLVTLGLGLMLGGLLIAAHVAFDVLLVGFVVHCRRQAVLRSQRRARERTQVVAEPRRRVRGIPDRMPPRQAPLAAPAPAPAARYDDAVPAARQAEPLQATGTDGWDSTWEPVPVPPPTYVGKPAAPPRPQRILDLTKPGQWTATLEGDDAGLGILEDEVELEDILDRRRAVNDW